MLDGDIEERRARCWWIPFSRHVLWPSSQAVFTFKVRKSLVACGFKAEGGPVHRPNVLGLSRGRALALGWRLRHRL